MVTLQESIDEKYGEKENEAEDFGFIVFVSCSPEAKAGMFPPLMTLNDYNIESFGNFGDLYSKVKHIRELDLTDNLLSDWSEIVNIINCFKSLTFLNLSNNLLSQPIDDNNNEIQEKLEAGNFPMRKVKSFSMIFFLCCFCLNILKPIYNLHLFSSLFWMEIMSLGQLWFVWQTNCQI